MIFFIKQSVQLLKLSGSVIKTELTKHSAQASVINLREISNDRNSNRIPHITQSRAHSSKRANKIIHAPEIRLLSIYIPSRYKRENSSYVYDRSSTFNFLG